MDATHSLPNVDDLLQVLPETHRRTLNCVVVGTSPECVGGAAIYRFSAGLRYLLGDNR
jgi:hypothetical protein